MSGSTYEDKIAAGRLDRAVRHVSDYWIPANPRLLKKVKHGLAEGYYDSRVEELVTDIESDLALFTRSLGSLISMMRENGEDLGDQVNPVELLHRCGIDQLKQILQLKDIESSPHSLETGTDLQLARMHEAIVSASTSEALAEESALDARGCYSAALLRQLGLALIAWNYPAVYQEAVQSIEPGESLEVRIASELGFSPSTLALRVFVSDGLPEDGFADLGIEDESRQGELEYLSAVGQTVVRVCRVGEALARSQHPECYPTARDDWEFARREIEERLGDKGLDIVFEKIEENLDNYVDLAPHVFRPALILDYEHEIDEREIVGDYYNPYLSQCEPREKAAIEELYRVLTADVRSGKNVRIFVDKVIPQTDFTGGCVFTVDPTTMKFVPQLEIGDMHLRKFGAVEYSVSASSVDIVSVAYQSNEPTVAYDASDTGEVMSVIAGIFGTSQRMGVLYLEAPGLVEESSKQLVHFRALQHAFNDCLGLG